MTWLHHHVPLHGASQLRNVLTIFVTHIVLLGNLVSTCASEYAQVPLCRQLCVK